MNSLVDILRKKNVLTEMKKKEKKKKIIDGWVMWCDVMWNEVMWFIYIYEWNNDLIIIYL